MDSTTPAPDDDGERPLWMKIAFYVVPLFSTSIVLYIIRYFLKGFPYEKDTKIKDKVVLITGANSGIGKETAIDLAQRGGKVYIGCRNVEKAEEALKDIKKRSKSDNVHFLQLDLASLDSVREFSQKFHAAESKLDILINNAGVMFCPKATTSDGFEMQLQTNHLAHFLLTNLLLDLLKAASPSRIVVISSQAHSLGSINKEDVNSDNSYSRFKAYFQSKLANILFMHELSKKLVGTGVTVNCLNPGFAVTAIFRHIPAIPDAAKTVLNPIFRQFINTAKEAAQTPIKLAVDPELEKISGKYYDKGRENKSSPESTNDDLSCWLWKKSEEMVGLNFV